MTQPLDELISSFLESAEDLKTRITDIESILNKQDLGDMRAGILVTTDYCEKEHDVLEKNVCGRADVLETNMHEQIRNFENSINKKIYASWLVLIFMVAGIGYVLKTHDTYLHELMKMVF